MSNYSVKDGTCVIRVACAVLFVSFTFLYLYDYRQWNLVDNKDLDYHYLGDFDREMLKVIKSEKNLIHTPVQEMWHNDADQIS